MIGPMTARAPTPMCAMKCTIQKEVPPAVAVGAKSPAGATRASDAWSVLAAHKLTADTRGHAPALSIAAMRRVRFPFICP